MKSEKFLMLRDDRILKVDNFAENRIGNFRFVQRLLQLIFLFFFYTYLFSSKSILPRFFMGLDHNASYCNVTMNLKM